MNDTIAGEAVIAPSTVCALFATGIARAAVVTIDGVPVTGVIVHEGHILVPFRAPMEQIGATVDWSDATQTGTASMSGEELVRAVVGQQTAYIDSYPKVLTMSNAHLDISADGNTATITDFDLAGVHAVGSGISSVDPAGKVLYLWVWLLPISAVVAGLGYFYANRQVTSGRRA